MTPVLSEVARRQEKAAENISRYLNSYPVYADSVGIDERLRGTPIGGVTEFDPYHNSARIYYNPDFLNNDYIRDCVVAHETAHLFQKEHKILEQLYPLMLEVNGQQYHLGLDFIEGTAELLAEKSTGKKLQGVYPREYNLAKAIDRVYPLKDLYRDIEVHGWQVLDTPEVRDILLREYSKPSMRSYTIQ